MRFLKRGIVTSEFWRVVPLYVIAGLAVWNGYSIDQMSGAVSTLSENLQSIMSALVAVGAIGGIAADNRQYTRTRGELKRHELSMALEHSNKVATMARSRAIAARMKRMEEKKGGKDV